MDIHWKRELAPTHRCKVCGALWRYWREAECKGFAGDSWQLCTNNAGKCCNNEIMDQQIEMLRLGDMANFIAAHHAVDHMVQSIEGPSSQDKIN